MERPTVLIISQDPEFAYAIPSAWQAERNSPAFLVNQAEPANFDLAIIVTTHVPESLFRSGVPIIHVSPTKLNLPGLITLPATDGWADLAILLAKQILERKALASELSRLSELRPQLEREASLGRYILEMRHSLNNALTSILGNSELMLMEHQGIPPSARLQVETIHNMGMRMNEILQRFTSLQKEMQLVEQQGSKKSARQAGAGR